MNKAQQAADNGDVSRCRTLTHQKSPSHPGSVQRPQNPPHPLLLCGLLVMHDAPVGGLRVPAGDTVSPPSAKPAHRPSCTAATGGYPLGSHRRQRQRPPTYRIHLKGWNLAGGKFMEQFGGAAGLAEMAAGWCPEHRDLSPALLSSSEGLQAPQLSGHVHGVPPVMAIS